MGCHEEGEGVVDEFGEVVEEHVAEAPADDGCDDEGGDEGALLVGVVGGAFFNIVEVKEGESEEEGEDVGEAVPADAVQGERIGKFYDEGV